MKRRILWASGAALFLAVLTTAAALGGNALGWWSLGAVTAQHYPVWGVDVSHHQHDIDWAQVARAPRIRFAYLKATEGGDFTDVKFADNWRQARAAGLRTGAYHFFTFCTPAEEQARHFLAVVPDEKDALPPVVDVEFGGNCAKRPDPAAMAKELSTFASLVEVERPGHRVLFYATWDAFQLYLRHTELTDRMWVRDLWHHPSLPGGIPWLIWQFDEHGKIPGIEGDVDLDAFAGDATALDRL